MTGDCHVRSLRGAGGEIPPVYSAFSDPWSLGGPWNLVIVAPREEVVRQSRNCRRDEGRSLDSGL